MLYTNKVNTKTCCKLFFIFCLFFMNKKICMLFLFRQNGHQALTMVIMGRCHANGQTHHNTNQCYGLHFENSTTKIKNYIILLKDASEEFLYKAIYFTNFPTFFVGLLRTHIYKLFPNWSFCWCDIAYHFRFKDTGNTMYQYFQRKYRIYHTANLHY